MTTVPCCHHGSLLEHKHEEGGSCSDVAEKRFLLLQQTLRDRVSDCCFDIAPAAAISFLWAILLVVVCSFNAQYGKEHVQETPASEDKKELWDHEFTIDLELVKGTIRLIKGAAQVRCLFRCANGCTAQPYSPSYAQIDCSHVGFSSDLASACDAAGFSVEAAGLSEDAEQ